MASGGQVGGGGTGFADQHLCEEATGLTEADAAVLREVNARSWGGARRSELQAAGHHDDDIHHCFMHGWLQYRRGIYGDIELTPQGRDALAAFYGRHGAPA